MPAIFISHSSLDQRAADDLKAVLAGLGFDRVFLDFDKVTGIGAGENWEKRLYEELTRCHAVVLILTPNWLASKWCFSELQQASALGKVILPIVFSPLGDSYVLPDIQAIDLIDWKREGLTRLEQRLNAITHELARGFRLASGRPPYPGIHAFEAEDAAIYFGRDEETRAVIEKLDARRTQGGVRFLLVIGASGAGKSSLLKAGILPQLARRRAQWLLLPVMRPEKAPLEAFSKVLAQHLGQENGWPEVHACLAGPNAVGRIERIARDLRVGEGRAATILLPIDQFEELFTVAEPGERAALLTLLAAILDPAHGLPLMIVATGRADVLQGLLETSALAPMMDTTPLLPMPLERVPILVEGPAAVTSLIVDKELPERIMRDVESPEALPLLAYTLHLLNGRSPDKRLTLTAYLTLGDGNLNPVQNAVRLGADEAIARLKPTEGEMAALRDSFIPHLVRLRLDDKRHVRQPAPLASLPRDAERLIHALIEARLLTSRTSDRGVPVVEVVHEALFSAWPTLRDWLSEEQNFLADIERLKGAHETWMQAAEAQKPQALLHGLLLSRARDWLFRHPLRFTSPAIGPLRAFIADSVAADDAERAHSQRLRRRVFQAMAVAVVILAAIAAFAGRQYFQADKERHEAETQRGIAQQQSKIAERQGEEAKQERREAEQQRDRAERNFRVAKQAADDMVFKLAQGLRNVAGMRVDSVRKILDGAQALMDQLAQAAPNDLDLQRSRSSMLNEFGETYAAVGDLSRATIGAEESLAIMRKLTAADPDNAGWQQGVSVSLTNVGDLRFAAGDRANALAAYEEGLTVRRKLAATDPGNAGWQRDVIVSLIKVGDVRLAAGDHSGALAASEEGLKIARKLAASDSGWQGGVGVSLNYVGDIKLAAGDRSGALAAYEEGLAIHRKLAATDSGNTAWQRFLSVSLNKVGHVGLIAGDRAGALAAFVEGLAIARNLTAADPGNAEWRRDLSVSLERLGDVRLAAGDRAGALAAFEESLAVHRKLAAADPGNAGWQRDIGVSLSRVGDVRLAAGDRSGALAAYEESLAIHRKLAAADLGNAGWQRDLSVSLERVGDVTLAAGDRSGALAAFEESLTVHRKLAAVDPGNAGWQRDIGVSLERVGDVRRAAGDRSGALAAFEESLAIRRKLAAADPGNAEWQRDLGVNLERAGDIRFAAGDRAGALASYEEGLAIRRKLAAADPGNAGWQRDVSVGLERIGDVRRAAGDRATALAAYEEGLAIHRKLAAADPDNTGWQRDLSVSLINVGDVRFAAGDRASALAAYEESLAIRRKLATADLGNTGWQRDVSVGLERVGDISLAAGNHANALAAHEEGLAIARKLAAADPDNAGWQRDVSLSLKKAGDVRLVAGDRPAALAAYEESLAIRRKLAAADPGNAGWQIDLFIGLYDVGTMSNPASARKFLTEGLSIAESLAYADKLPENQKGWPQKIRDTLAKLPPAQIRPR